MVMLTVFNYLNPGPKLPLHVSKHVKFGLRSLTFTLLWDNSH